MQKVSDRKELRRPTRSAACAVSLCERRSDSSTELFSCSSRSRSPVCKEAATRGHER